MKKAAPILMLFLVINWYARAQVEPDTIRYIIETTDNNEYTGKLISENDDFVIIETTMLGEIRIPKPGIKKMTLITPKELNQGEYWFENPHATRYFYLPNGYNLKAKEGYYQNAWVLVNQVSVGITNNFSLGAGMIPTFLFGAGEIPLWITPKVGFPIIDDKLNVGGGILAATILGADASFGLAYSMISFGNRDKNTTFGAGWSFTQDGWGERPTISLASMIRVSKKAYFLTENYLISTPFETIGLISLGGRSVQKKLAVDWGLIIPVNIGADVFLAFPWLSITLPFGEN